MLICSSTFQYRNPSEDIGTQLQSQATVSGVSGDAPATAGNVETLANKRKSKGLSTWNDKILKQFQKKKKRSKMNVQSTEEVTKDSNDRSASVNHTISGSISKFV